ncbi:MAG: permease-like cell division protein FtsX, partial [Actinomycetota bacterium]|nr:permease-like cell division protein FtsX [Actinomycetota bacterium]
MSFPFFLKEAVRGLSRNSAPALAAMLTVLLTALVLGVFIPIVQATTGTANEVRDRVVVNVYVADEATQGERQQLAAALERTTNVKSVEFVSKAEGLAEAKRKNPEAFAEGTKLLGANPLPDMYRVVPDDPDQVGSIVDRLAPVGADGAREPSLAAIDEVRNKEEDTAEILSATGLVKILTAGLAALLIFASIALVANTI